MDFVGNQEELIENIFTLENYLSSSNEEEVQFAKGLVRRGKTICVYKVNGENHFSPSRFIGYKNNSMPNHWENEEKDGRDTNPVISGIIGRPFSNDTIDEKFIAYAISLGVQAHENKRKFWRIKDAKGKNLNINL